MWTFQCTVYLISVYSSLFLCTSLQSAVPSAIAPLTSYRAVSHNCELAKISVCRTPQRSVSPLIKVAAPIPITDTENAQRDPHKGGHSSHCQQNQLRSALDLYTENTYVSDVLWWLAVEKSGAHIILILNVIVLNIESLLKNKYFSLIWLEMHYTVHWQLYDSVFMCFGNLLLISNNINLVNDLHILINDYSFSFLICYWWIWYTRNSSINNIKSPNKFFIKMILFNLILSQIIAIIISIF